MPTGGGGAAQGAAIDSPYVIVSATDDPNLDAERRLVFGDGIDGLDGGANGTLTYNVGGAKQVSVNRAVLLCLDLDDGANSGFSLDTSDLLTYQTDGTGIITVHPDSAAAGLKGAITNLADDNFILRSSKTLSASTPLFCFEVLETAAFANGIKFFYKFRVPTPTGSKDVVEIWQEGSDNHVRLSLLQWQTANESFFDARGILINEAPGSTVPNNTFYEFSTRKEGIEANTSKTTSFKFIFGGNTRHQLNDTTLAFHGATAVSKQTITGSRAGNAALADFLTKMDTLGLITDSTTA